MIPEYRPAYGFGLWIGASVVDLLALQSGVLSFAGFAIAFAWSQGGVQVTPGEWKEVKSEGGGGDQS